MKAERKREGKEVAQRGREDWPRSREVPRFRFPDLQSKGSCVEVG